MAQESRASPSTLRGQWHTFLICLTVLAALATSRWIEETITELYNQRQPHVTPLRVPPGRSKRTYEGPVIGVMGQRVKRRESNVFGGTQLNDKLTISAKFAKYGNNYTPASYVRFLEAAGVTVIPIPTNLPLDELKAIFASINGIYFTGGAQRFPDSDFYQTAKLLYEWAVEENERGDYFPMWGTCLGFQLLNNLAANATTDLRRICRAHDLARPVNLTQEAGNSRALRGLDAAVLEALQKDPAAYYFHTKCITLDLFEGPISDMRVVASNHDLDNLQYASFVEHRKYPFYATQFHPEKVAFEWNPKTSVERPFSGILLAQHLSNFFRSEAEKSSHRFSNPADLHARQIENYPLINTMLLDHTTLTGYYFTDDTSYGRPNVDTEQIREKYEVIRTLADREMIKY